MLNFSLLFTLSGCMFDSFKDLRKPVVTIRESGYFQYMIVGESTHIKNEDSDALIIVGFTDSGQEQETLDIPIEIDGHPVKRIGLTEQNFYYNNNHLFNK